MSLSSNKNFEAKFIKEGADKILSFFETFFYLGQGELVSTHQEECIKDEVHG